MTIQVQLRTLYFHKVRLFRCIPLSPKSPQTVKKKKLTIALSQVNGKLLEACLSKLQRRICMILSVVLCSILIHQVVLCQDVLMVM